MKKTDSSLFYIQMRKLIFLILITISFVISSLWYTSSGNTVMASAIKNVFQNPVTLTIMSTNLGICNTNCQPHWGYYDAGDAPEGAFMGWYSGEEHMDALINIAQPLPAGSYRVFIKGINYDQNSTVEAYLGNNYGSIVTNDRDWNGQWTNAITVTSTEEVNQIRLRFVKGNTDAAKFLLRGIYITNHESELIDKTDTILNLTYPTQMDDSPPVKRNFVENSSFEMGMSHGWGLYSNFKGSFAGLIDSSEFQNGNASFKLPLDGDTLTYGNSQSLYSKTYSVAPNKKHTLSVFVKAEPGKTVTGTIGLLNTYEPPSGQGFEPRHSIWQSFIATDQWQRISVTGYLLAYPTADYQIVVTGNVQEDAYLFVDAVQLEEGELETYASVNFEEISFSTDAPGNVMYSDENNSQENISPITLNVYSSRSIESPSVEVPVNYYVYDHTNALVTKKTQKIMIDPQNTVSIPVDIDLSKKGVFRVVGWIDGKSNSEEEFVFSVIAPPVNQTAEHPSMGIHSNFTQHQLELMKHLGFKSLRTLSTGQFFRWRNVEPVDDQFIWYDTEVQRANNLDLSILGTIGTNNFWPAWADVNGMPNLDKWEEFVGQIVDHYKYGVKYWEIWNEPQGTFTTDFYAEMLKRASDAIEANDPDAKIIAMGGVSDLNWVLDVIDKLETNYPNWNWYEHVDFISTHIYSANPHVSSTAWKEAITDVYEIPVWNTETGWWDLGGSMGTNGNFVSWGKSIWPHQDAHRYYNAYETGLEKVSQNFLSSIGGGFTGYYYYDARLFNFPGYFVNNVQRSHPTILEYDRTIRPKGALLANLNNFLENPIGLGELYLTDNNVKGVLFKKGGNTLLERDHNKEDKLDENGVWAALWLADDTQKLILPQITSGNFEVYDIFGNRISTDQYSTKRAGSYNILVTRMPILIRAVGIDEIEMRQIIETATISETQDTKSPHLALHAPPRGPVKTNSSIVLRWNAFDNLSVPLLDNNDNNNPTSILYRYMLNGYNSSWSSWSPDTKVVYKNLPIGNYIFWVQAKDESGNLSQIEKHRVLVETVGNERSTEVSKFPEKGEIAR